MDKKKKICLFAIPVCFLLISVLAIWLMVNPPTTTIIVEWEDQPFMLDVYNDKSGSIIIVAEEQFRLTDVNFVESYFILTHELGDGEHFIPLQIPLEMDYLFNLEGEAFLVRGYDGSCGGRRVILQHIYVAQASGLNWQSRDEGDLPDEDEITVFTGDRFPAEWG